MLTCDQRSEQEVGLKLTIIGGRGVLQKLPELAFLPPMCLSQQDLQYPFLKTSSIPPPPLSKTPSTDGCSSAVGWPKSGVRYRTPLLQTEHQRMFSNEHYSNTQGERGLVQIWWLFFPPQVISLELVNFTQFIKLLLKSNNICILFGKPFAKCYLIFINLICEISFYIFGQILG